LIIIHPNAAVEAQAARAWYATRNHAVGMRFLAEYDRAINREDTLAIAAEPGHEDRSGVTVGVWRSAPAWTSHPRREVRTRVRTRVPSGEKPSSSNGRSWRRVNSGALLSTSQIRAVESQLAVAIPVRRS
jgi:hypothetical protein